jgi:hypothetical protein
MQEDRRMDGRTYTHTDRLTDSHTDTNKQTGRRKGGYTGREEDRQTMRGSGRVCKALPLTILINEKIDRTVAKKI